MNNAEHGLTTGPIYKKMLFFAFPIFLSNLFQQLYSTVDALIVGNAIDEKALAAVSAGGSTIFLLIGFVGGLSAGTGVIIARHYGAKSYENLKKAIHTTFALSLIFGLILTVVSLILTPVFLRFLGTPDDVLPSSIIYFRIFCSGLWANSITSFGTSIMQAIGNSKQPMMFLIISTLSNIALDLLFILGFNMGIEGAAYASLIAMILNAVLITIKLSQMGHATNGEIGLIWKDVKIDKSMLRPLVMQGVPSGLQNSVTSISHLVIQSSINSFGSVAMAGCASYSRIEGFIFLPIISFALALTTFISQNIGAGKLDRVKTSMRYGVVSAVVLAEIIGLFMFIFAPYLVGLFTNVPEVIEIGVLQMRTISLFYCLLAYSHGCSAILRGLGKPAIAMIVFLAAWCIFRIFFVVTGLYIVHDIRVIFWAFPAAWALSGILFTGFVIKTVNKEFSHSKA